MILSKKSILEAVQKGEIGISDFNEDNLKEASYTFTLAPKLVVDEKEVFIDGGYVLQPNQLLYARKAHTEWQVRLYFKYSRFCRSERCCCVTL
jgi:hypothetical protein